MGFIGFFVKLIFIVSTTIVILPLLVCYSTSVLQSENSRTMQDCTLKPTLSCMLNTCSDVVRHSVLHTMIWMLSQLVMHVRVNICWVSDTLQPSADIFHWQPSAITYAIPAVTPATTNSRCRAKRQTFDAAHQPDYSGRKRGQLGPGKDASQ